ncbi:MAG TPA: DHA2 family efflux MFS transporter permease subunit [Gemmatimonadaceae bacterium]|nr:DHA2 family efflux MFS transporter permease subunit [Gemmatimonadaceae bacterium]
MTAAASPDAVLAAQAHGDKHKWLIAIAVVIACLMQVIDTSIVNVALPQMMGELGANIDEIAWVSTGYILASVIVMPMTGWLAAFFGRKRYFAASIVIFTVASIFCGLSHSLGALVFWRVVQGLGGGALLTTSQAILYEVFPPEEIGLALALFGLGVMVGPTIGPTLGGWLTDRYSWPWIFFINLPIGVIAVTMVIVYIHDAAHHVKASTVDYPGILLLAAAIGSLQYVLEHGEREDWFDSRRIVVLAVVAAVTSVALVWRELRIKEPVVDFRVLRHRETAVGTMIGIVFGLGLLGSVFVLPIFLQGMLHMTPMQTGLVLMPGAIATAVTMGVSGRLLNKIDVRLMCTAGAILFFVSMHQLAAVTSAAGPRDFFMPLIWRGLGLGLMFVPLTNITLGGLKGSELGHGSAVSNFFRQLGGSFGIAVMATLLTRFTAQAHSILLEHVSAYDPAALGRVSSAARGLMARGIDPSAANAMALRAINGQVAVQANVIAFSKVYQLSGWILLCTIPFLLFVRKTKPAAGAHIAAE